MGRMAHALAVAVLVLAPATGPAERSAGTLRVGASGDYPPFSVATESGELEGFDAEVARAYAAERGLELEFVRFAWPELLAALASGRFDVAMSGVTVQPERSIAGRFSVPLLETAAVVLAPHASGITRLDEIDRPGTRLGVNAGGYLERVARAHFGKATLVVIPDNAEVLRSLRSGAIDCALTDDVEARLWERELDGAARIGPLTRDRKAYLVQPERSGLAADLDAWLLAREADGSLAKLRARHLGAATRQATATPHAALVAALDERISLMPAVAAAKRERVLPIEAPARERRVLDAGVAAVAAAAERSGRRAPDEAAIRAFLQAQIDAAKAVQLAAVRDPEFVPPAPLPDLDAELRPALLRIGEKIAALVVALPENLPTARLGAACRDGLRSRWLDEAERGRLCAALLQLASAPR